MTRDEILTVIGTTYDSAATAMSATDGSWAIRIDTSPQCEVVLTESFVAMNIDREGMSLAQFAEYLKAVAASEWNNSSGISTLVLR